MSTTAAMQTQRPGIVIWANGIRTTMANDPGRQTLQDQIQANGYSFLDDYLDNILAGPRRDPIIELVKTPGRKRIAGKKTKTATVITKAQPLAVSTWESDNEKENCAPASNLFEDSAPLNSFHKALLQAKVNKLTPLTPRKDVRVQFAQEPSPVPETPSKAWYNEDAISFHDDDDEHAVELLVSSSPPPERMVEPEENHAETIAELTVIVEDDEPHEPFIESGAHEATNCDEAKDKREHDHPLTIVSNSASKQMEVDCGEEEDPPRSQRAKHQPVEIRASPDVSKHVAENVAASCSVGQVAETHDSEPFPSTVTASPETLHKKNVLFFPTIGAPSPLRKSMRIPREAIPTLPSVAKLPQQPTRSSWLVKAREAKAIEENSKRATASSGHLASLTERSSMAKMKRKSGEMADLEFVHREDDRKNKVAKTTSDQGEAVKASANAGSEPANFMQSEVATVTKMQTDSPHEHYEDHFEGLNDEKPTSDSNDLINNLKRTVEDFSARAGKSLGKSLGGNAATVLAEARAAAEARIAMRHASETDVTTASSVDLATDATSATPAPVSTPPQPPTISVPPASDGKESGRSSNQRNTKDRLSVSDLVSAFEGKTKTTEPIPPQSNVAPPNSTAASFKDAANASTSTTPPQSPPPRRVPVENPSLQKTMETNTKAPSSKTTIFDGPTLFSHLLGAETLKPHEQLNGESQSTLTSTQPSMFSDGIFTSNSQNWLSSTQETQFTDPIPSQSSLFTFSKPVEGKQGIADGDEKTANESWHLDDKFEQAWSADTSTTWNTAATRFFDELVREPTNSQQPTDVEQVDQNGVTRAHQSAEVASLNTGLDLETEQNSEMELDEDDDIGSVGTSNHYQTQQTSKALQNITSSPSVAHNIFSTASKFVSNVLGKKGKAEPVKSIQLAAAAAKKQQEEQEKKATRLKDMEARRQQALQRKADEDKAREDKKLKDESDRRKRERDETSDKRQVRPLGKKLTQMEDVLAKKTKTEGVAEKKPEPKKLLSKDNTKKDAPPSKIGKPALYQSQTTLNSSMNAGKQLKPTLSSSVLGQPSVKLVSKAAEGKQFALGSSQIGHSVGKGKGKAVDGDVDRQPAQVMQAAMQARVQAQIRADQAAPFVSENIELPDINSEYSDSDDEDRKRTFDPPEWAQSPELRNALQTQSTVNPDDIFGAIRPLRMEELFKTRTSRFRARTSSANWAGTDELTAAEERAYAKRMGYLS